MKSFLTGPLGHKAMMFDTVPMFGDSGGMLPDPTNGMRIDDSTGLGDGSAIS